MKKQTNEQTNKKKKKKTSTVLPPLIVIPFASISIFLNFKYEEKVCINLYILSPDFYLFIYLFIYSKCLLLQSVFTFKLLFHIVKSPDNPRIYPV